MKTLTIMLLLTLSASGFSAESSKKKTDRNIEITLNNISSLISTLYDALSPSQILAPEDVSNLAKLKIYQCTEVGRAIGYTYAAKNSLGYYNLGNLSLEQEVTLGQINGLAGLLSGIVDSYCLGEGTELEKRVEEILNEADAISEDLSKI